MPNYNVSVQKILMVNQKEYYCSYLQEIQLHASDVILIRLVVVNKLSSYDFSLSLSLFFSSLFGIDNQLLLSSTVL